LRLTVHGIRPRHRGSFRYGVTAVRLVRNPTGRTAGPGHATIDSVDVHEVVASA